MNRVNLHIGCWVNHDNGIALYGGAIEREDGYIEQTPFGTVASNNDYLPHLHALIMLLSRLEAPTKVGVFLENEFVANCVNAWIELWRKNDWQTQAGKKVVYLEEIQRLAELLSRHDVHASYVMPTMPSPCSSIKYAAKEKSSQMSS